MTTGYAPLSVLTFNIGNPSRDRAERQLSWLARRPEQVLVLTETAASDGCAFLAERFTAAGYQVTSPLPEHRERGVMIVHRAAAAATVPAWKPDYLPCRVASAVVQAAGGPVEVAGVYVPSRDASPAKTDRKRRFLREFADALPSAEPATRRIVIGDLNILEPDHQPAYRFFQQFEYDAYLAFGAAGYRDAFRLLHPGAAEHSWVGRTGDGYRYDHAFVSPGLADQVTACCYLHQTRIPAEAGPRLTDHSALTVTLAPPVPLLNVADPQTAPALDALF